MQKHYITYKNNTSHTKKADSIQKTSLNTQKTKHEIQKKKTHKMQNQYITQKKTAHNTQKTDSTQKTTLNTPKKS